MARHHREGTTTWFLLGGGFCVQAAWCSGTLLGHQLGAVISHPERFGLDFAFISVFTALVFSFWHGKKDLLPWLVTASLALLTERLIPGKWYILAGGVGGALVAALITDEREKNG
jgi:predicted branched-subunit amino acid permease